jgi:hypothetical protein
MFYKYKIGETNLCTCCTAPMTAEDLLQTCPNYNSERLETWEEPVSLHEKLYGDAWNLKLTAAFFKLISVRV